MSHSENTKSTSSGNQGLDERIREITKLAKSDTFSQLSKNHQIIHLREVLTTIDQIQRELAIIRALAQDHLIDIQLTSQLKMFDSSMNRKND